MSFQGSIQELPVPDIIQLVSVSGKTGMFTLVRGSERGFIYLKNGQMVHAKIGDLVGEEAIYALAIWSSGDFQFTPSEESESVSIHRSNTSLLMEAARRLDEWKVLSRKVPGVDYVPVFVSRDSAEPVTLSPPEWNLVIRIDGRKTVEELARTARQLLVRDGQGVVRADHREPRRDALARLDPPLAFVLVGRHPQPGGAHGRREEDPDDPLHARETGGGDRAGRVQPPRHRETVQAGPCRRSTAGGESRRCGTSSARRRRRSPPSAAPPA